MVDWNLIEVCIVSVLILLIVIIFIYCCYKRRKTKKEIQYQRYLLYEKLDQIKLDQSQNSFIALDSVDKDSSRYKDSGLMQSGKASNFIRVEQNNSNLFETDTFAKLTLTTENEMIFNS